MISPRDPEQFLTAFLPARFEGAASVFAGITSVGSITFRVPSRGEWSLRLVDGRLEVVRGSDDDTMVQVTIPEEDFAVLISESVDRSAGRTNAASAGPLRALVAKPDAARMVRHVPGSLLFVARDGDLRRRILVTPGKRVANLDSPECTIECALADMVDAQSKGVPPMQLFVAGKLRLTGNVQIAMALAGAFG
jgi:hypothetical protein